MEQDIVSINEKETILKAVELIVTQGPSAELREARVAAYNIIYEHATARDLYHRRRYGIYQFFCDECERAAASSVTVNDFDVRAAALVSVFVYLNRYPIASEALQNKMPPLAKVVDQNRILCEQRLA